MHRIFVDGAWSDAGAVRALEILNPATLRPLGAAADCGPQDVARAVSAARAALPGWRGLDARARGVLLIEIGARIRAQKPELAALLMRESGKPLCESGDCVDAAAAVFERGAAVAAPETEPSNVVAAWVPSNFPLLLMAVAVARAVGAGDTLVCMPAPQNPLAGLMLARAFERLPPGVVNVVTGGLETARTLARHPGVASLDLEFGSVDAFLVCKDADLDLAVPAIAWARLMNGGQGCGFGGHAYVDRSIATDFVDRMHPCVGFLDVDDPAKPPTDLGPLISLEAAQRVEDQVGRTLRAGAKLILGGRRFRPSGLPGHFFQPTILTDVRPGSVPAREHIRGPVITVTPVTDMGQAISMHSSGPGADFGVSIFTSDSELAIESLGALGPQNVRINDPASPRYPKLPFASLRHVGVRAALGEASGLQTAPVLTPKPWWFPYGNR